MIEEIKALKELLDMGAITEEEYEAKKAEILSAPVPAPAAAPTTPPQSIPTLP